MEGGQPEPGAPGGAEHGDWVLHVRVPQVKLLFYPGLLARAPLSGEGEVLAIGGHYEVEARYD